MIDVAFWPIWQKTDFVALNYTLLSQVAFSLFSFIFAVQVIIHIVCV